MSQNRAQKVVPIAKQGKTTYTCVLLVTAAMSTRLALKAFFLPFFFFLAKNAAVSAIFSSRSLGLPREK